MANGLPTLWRVVFACPLSFGMLAWSPAALARADGHGLLSASPPADSRDPQDAPLDPTKGRLRQALRDEPDADLALKLAEIVHGELQTVGHRLAIPSTFGRVSTPLVDPQESVETLRAAWETALGHAPRHSAQAFRAGTGLAKLALLRGDWSAMETALAHIGQGLPDLGDRPWLAPPPESWAELGTRWRRANETVCGGSTALTLRVLRPDGRGVPGVQLVAGPVDAITAHPYIGTSWFAPATTLVGRPALLPTRVGRQRRGLRWTMTDESGRARLDGLPSGRIGVEITITFAALEENSVDLSVWTFEDGVWSEGLGPLPRHGFEANEHDTIELPTLWLRSHPPRNVDRHPEDKNH